MRPYHLYEDRFMMEIPKPGKTVFILTGGPGVSPYQHNNRDHLIGSRESRHQPVTVALDWFLIHVDPKAICQIGWLNATARRDDLTTWWNFPY